jgi:single-strand DNA-binding protein
MAGYNRVVMIGNLTRDPEIRTVGTQSVCKLNIASNKQYKNKQTGAMVSDVCFIDVEVWGPQVESCRQYLQKGKQVLVEGRLKLDSWKDQEGVAKSKHSIAAERVIFLNSGARDDQSSEIMDDHESNVSLSRQTIRAATGNRLGANKKKETKEAHPSSFLDSDPFAEDDLPF